PGDVLAGGAVRDTPEVEQLDEGQLASRRVGMGEVVPVEHVLGAELGDAGQRSAPGQRSDATGGTVLVDQAELDSGGASDAPNRRGRFCDGLWPGGNRRLRRRSGRDGR